MFGFILGQSWRWDGRVGMIVRYVVEVDFEFNCVVVDAALILVARVKGGVPEGNGGIDEGFDEGVKRLVVHGVEVVDIASDPVGTSFRALFLRWRFFRDLDFGFPSSSLTLQGSHWNLVLYSFEPP